MTTELLHSSNSRKFVLTLISTRELPKHVDKAQALKVFDAISHKPAGYPGKLIDAAGAERWGWEWAPFRTVKEAAVFARRMAEFCVKQRIRVFNLNCESEWAGTEPFHHRHDPSASLREFVRVFRLYAPSDCLLAYNGFSWSRTSDGRTLHTPQIAALFDIWSPMNYTTTVTGLAKHWARKCYLYKRSTPRLRVLPMVGVGRVAKDGKIWGFWDALYSLFADECANIEGLNFFFGNGARDQLLKGHPAHPALRVCVPALREVPCG